MPPRGLLKELRQMRARVEGRYVERAFAVGRDATSEPLFTVGGRFDTKARRIVGPAAAPVRVALRDTQLAAALGYAAYLDARLREQSMPGLTFPAGGLVEREVERRGLRAGAERPILFTLFSERGTGKTHVALLLELFSAVAIPDGVQWIVPPASTRIDEMRIIFDRASPPGWCEWKERAGAWALATGTRIRVISGDQSDSVRQGGYELCLQNEAQAQTWDLFTTLQPGIRNVNQRPPGLLVLAGNYALKARGDWTNDLLDGIERGDVDGWAFDMDAPSEGTRPVPSRLASRIDAAIRSVSKAAADADARGIRRRLGEYAFPAFRPWPTDRLQHGHVGRPPEVGWSDVTLEAVRRREGVRFPRVQVVLTADFQRAPGCVAAEGRVLRRPDGRQVYYLRRYLAPEQGTEKALGELILRTWPDVPPREILVIGDSSGATQDGAHTPGAFEAGRDSFSILRGFGLTVVPLVYALDPRAKTEAGKNPEVDDSVRQVIDICEEERLLIDPTCERMIEGMRKAKLKRRPTGAIYMDPAGGHSHPGDVGRYFMHAFEPAPGPERKRDDTVTDRVLATRGVIP